eukprot:scaffold19515_cov114-Isochrysis_galbana.AAC.5
METRRRALAVRKRAVPAPGRPHYSHVKRVPQQLRFFGSVEQVLVAPAAQLFQRGWGKLEACALPRADRRRRQPVAPLVVSLIVRGHPAI